jgi:hypothetical protein
MLAEKCVRLVDFSSGGGMQAQKGGCCVDQQESLRSCDGIGDLAAGDFVLVYPKVLPYCNASLHRMMKRKTFLYQIVTSVFQFLASKESVDMEQRVY